MAMALSGVAWGGEIHEAAEAGDVKKVTALLKSEPRLAFSKDDQGETPLERSIDCENHSVSRQCREVEGVLVNGLIAELTDPDSEARSIAADTLRPNPDQFDRSVPALVAALKDPSSKVRISAANALSVIENNGASKQRALRALIVALGDPEPKVREAVVGALGAEIDNNRRNSASIAAIDALINSLMDPDSAVRHSAAIELGNEDRWDGSLHRARRALLAALKKPDISVVAGAYEFFVRWGELGSEDPLVEALHEFGTKDMAETFVNCGNGKLEHAGFIWADEHSYIIKSQSSKYSISPHWGRK